MTIVHFVGFRGDEYARAVRVFGEPHYVHPTWDVRAEQEFAPGDRIIYANRTPRRAESRDEFMALACG